MKKAIFKTKMTRDYDRNGQVVEIIKAKPDRATMFRYDVKFPDGHIIKNVYPSELVFD